jgi:hypothetical protein
MVAEFDVRKWYAYSLPERCRILADAGFVRDSSRIWRHPDGRAIGEGVMVALIDSAFVRFVGVETSPLGTDSRKSQRKSAGLRKNRKAK